MSTMTTSSITTTAHDRDCGDWDSCPRHGSTRTHTPTEYGTAGSAYRVIREVLELTIEDVASMCESNELAGWATVDGLTRIEQGAVPVPAFSAALCQFYADQLRAAHDRADD
ncbi:hypothetical protein ncot_13445 [Nocardioides sp. JQ2195]|uniref:hypothetical protein n=1 Tax=Nocardioides sp. JQ2195 TaxID=2592334 RepID=UPI00143E81C9|nr:hypothetical protein [Nocardioides sp. JQ2195]QIX27501.1 hypothetical protein ncot_13445 [Nocardioides sp. JQ2195]